MKKRGSWRLGALASAIALLGSLASLEAHALALGRITVQSALGEPLRAEIDIADINAEEAASLRAGVASPEAFKSSGLEYTAAVTDLRVSLQKRPDGRSYLRLTSNRPVSEPFVDLVLDASWSSGRVTRDYTMLFDPPTLRQAAPVATPTAPVLSRPVPPSAAGIGAIPYSPPMSAAATRAATAAKAAPATKPSATGQQVEVKSGDTAGKIAAQNKPASLSLDQMLVALLRGNPNAFIGGNINRLKAGAVLEMPDADTASAISSSEASRTIVAQSKDFNDFRRKLAQAVPATQAAAPARQAGGKVEAKVEDRAPAAATPDKLTLSKGAVQSKAAAEEKIAKDRQTKAASDRVAELSKNINDLNKLGTGTPAAAPATTASGAKPPGISVPAPAIVPATVAASAPKTMAAVASPVVPAPTASAAATPAPVASAPSATSAATAAVAAATTASAATPTAATPSVAAASAPAPAASQPVAAVVTLASAPAAVKAPVAPPPPPEPSLLDELTENPFVLPAFGGLLVLLAAIGFYRYRRRGSPAQVDSSFLESRLQPDSFFGASGGQRIDTNEGGATGSSLVYSPSQLDAAGDVDPVAEADVYLAYGRDLQAEEILKEAMRTNPARVAIHAKLMEIYAKRRDAKAFEVVAIEAFNLTRGEGPEWAYIGEMGRELDPANSMYQPGGQPSSDRGERDSGPHSGAGFGSSTIPQMIEPEHEEPSASVDFDLDLDFSMGDEPAAPSPAPAPSTRPTVQKVEPTVAMKPVPEPAFGGLDMDFGTGTVALKPTADALSASGLSFTATQPVTARPVVAAAPAVMDSGMLEFDLGSLSLDLDAATTESPSLAAAPAVDGPLETKFALAEEFRSLGDTDGARSLAQEVVAQAQGPLKNKAQAFLKSLT